MSAGTAHALASSSPLLGGIRGGDCGIDKIFPIIPTHNPGPAYENDFNKKRGICQEKTTNSL